MKQASDSEWRLALVRISRDLFDPASDGELPNVPKACECTELGIWSMTTRINGHIAIVWAWLYRTVDGNKWLSRWEFQFIWKDGRWYLTNYA